MSQKLHVSGQRHCRASINYSPISKELKNNMLQSIASVREFSRVSSASSSHTNKNSIVKCLEKVRDICERPEIVSDFEPIEEFIKKVGTDQLRKYDIIQYNCKKGKKSYCHWALYDSLGSDGLEYIIHFGPEDGGTVKKSRIKYSDENYPCRVNNLTEYAKKKGYTESSEEDITIVANLYYKMKKFPYHLLKFNCGHMVMHWKYGVPFNPESSSYIRTVTTALFAGGVISAVVCGVIGYVIEWLPHFCICACIGGAPLIGIGVLVIASVAFIGYKYYRKTRYNIQKIEMKKISQTVHQLTLDLNTIDTETEINGVLITEVNDEMPILNDESELNGNNCEITLYSGDNVVHMVSENNKVIVRKHSINNTYPCCKEVDHKIMKEAIKDVQQKSDITTEPKTA